MLLGLALAQGEGESCESDATVCDSNGLFCAVWEDSNYGPQYTCESCQAGSDNEVFDSENNKITY